MVDPRDWTKLGTGAIAQTVLSTVSPGAIILLHDRGGNREQTLAEMPDIISGPALDDPRAGRKVV